MNMRQYIFIILVMLTIAGCKEKENIPPVVEIFEPYSGQFYAQGDTLFYHFKVSDDESVTNVRVSISNSSSQTTFSRNYINAGPTKEYKDYILTEGLSITGSDFSFVVSATDGEDETRVGKAIFINQSPRIRKAIYAATEINSNSYEIIKIDSNYSMSNLLNHNGDFLNLEISSFDQILYTSGKYSGDLIAYDLQNNILKWTEPALSVGGNPAFHGINLYDNLVFVSYDDEKIKAFDKNKSIKFSTQTGVSEYAGKIFKKDNLVLTEEKSYPFTETRLTSYYFGTGSPYNNITIGLLDVLDIYHKADDVYVIFGNENNTGEIFYYYLNQNALWQPYQIPTGDTIRSTTYVEFQNAVLVQTNTGLYKFSFSNNSYLTLMGTANFDVIKYDDLNNQLIAASGTTINFYSYPQLQLIQSINASAPVKDLEILYSR